MGLHITRETSYRKWQTEKSFHQSKAVFIKLIFHWMELKKNTKCRQLGIESIRYEQKLIKINYGKSIAVKYKTSVMI